MISAISVENMKLSDQKTIASGIPGLELMRRAAEGIYRSADWSGNIAIVVGSGNNGGDGFALAGILAERAIPCTVYTVSDHWSADSCYYADRAAQLQVPVHPFVPGRNMFAAYDMIADCLLGTGFHGCPRGLYRDAILEINQSDAFVISADINSGLNGDTGMAELAVRSNLTVAIGCIKNGLLLGEARQYIRQLVCVDIGIQPVHKENYICEKDEWLAMQEHFAVPVDLTQDYFIYEGTIFFRRPDYLR